MKSFVFSLGAKGHRLELGRMQRHFHTPGSDRLRSFGWRKGWRDQGERLNKINLSVETKWTLEEQLCAEMMFERNDWTFIRRTRCNADGEAETSSLPSHRLSYVSHRDELTDQPVVSTHKRYFGKHIILRLAHPLPHSSTIRSRSVGFLWELLDSLDLTLTIEQILFPELLPPLNPVSVQNTNPLATSSTISHRRSSLSPSPSPSQKIRLFIQMNGTSSLRADLANDPRSVSFHLIRRNQFFLSDLVDKSLLVMIETSRDNFFLRFQGKWNESGFLSFFKTITSKRAFSHRSLDTNQRAAAASSSCDLRGEEWRCFSVVWSKKRTFRTSQLVRIETEPNLSSFVRP